MIYLISSSAELPVKRHPPPSNYLADGRVLSSGWNDHAEIATAGWFIVDLHVVRTGQFLRVIDSY